MKIFKFIFPILVLASSANAAIIYSGTKNILIPTTFVGVYIDIDGGGTVAEEGAGWDINPLFGGEGIASSPSFRAVTATILLDAPISNLAFGQTVGASSLFAATYPGGFSGSSTHVGNGIGQFATSNEGYIGFVFNTNSNAGPLYGWMRVELSNTSALGLVKDWAYQDAGTAITVGAVPEPSVFLSLFTGCAVLLYRRRNR